MNNLTSHLKYLAIPEPMQNEVQDYLDYLLFKNKSNPIIKHPKAGCMKGTFKMNNNFDEPLDDFREYTE